MAILNLQDPKNQALIQAVAQQVYAMLPAQGKQAMDLACDARGVPATAVATKNGNGNGYTAMGNGNGCGCNFTPGAKPLPPNGNPGPVPPYNPPVPNMLPPNCGVPGLPPSTPIGTWGCEVVDRDLAPCQIAKIMREQKLATIVGELAGPLVADSVIGVEIADIGVSHFFCVDYIKVTVSDGGDPPSETTIAIPEIGLQTEIVVQNPDGTYSHAWTWYDPERPSYLGITDGRCRCETLCNCVSALAHVRVRFVLPEAVADGSTLRVELWGRRKDWASDCGQCPPCMICDHELLTDDELDSKVSQVYVISDGT